MKRGLVALLFVGLTIAGCSSSADNGTTASSDEALASTTTTEPTTTTTATATTSADAPVETTEAPPPSWPAPISYQSAIYDPATDSILFVGGIPEKSRVWKLDTATMTFMRLSDLPMHYEITIPMVYEAATDTMVILQTESDLSP